MRTIDEVYLTTGAQKETQVLAVSTEQPKISLSNLGDTGAPHAVKTTYPIVQRVPLLELELTYLYNPVVFNGVNKIVQTIMSAKHEVVAKNYAVQKFFDTYLAELGNSGSDITWEELLSQIFKFQCIYGRSFVENIYNKKGNRIVDWDLIDPKKMDYAKSGNARIVLDKFNKPIGYIEVVPMEVPVPDNFLPPDIAPYITMWPNSIYLEPKRVAQIKLFTVGDGFYPIGLVEPIYKTSLRKLNVEEALANAIWRHGFPIFLAKIGDSNHEPTPQQVQSILEKLRDASFKQELSIPYYYDLSILESKKAEKLREHLEYFKDNEVTGMGIPKPYATGGGEACYSSDTQTLTKDGWKSYWEIDSNKDEIATVNPDTGRIEYHKPTDTRVYDYKGKMHHYKSSCVDILVTPKHKMYVHLKTGEWQKISSEDITANRFNFKSTVEYGDKDVSEPKKFILPAVQYQPQSNMPKELDKNILMDDWLEFLGWYISEGWASKEPDKYSIEISNLNKSNLNKIKECISRMGFKFNEKMSRGRIEGYRINNKSLCVWLIDNCGNNSYTKRIPDFVLNKEDLSKRQLGIILESLVLGDGTHFGTTGITYTTISPYLADDVCELMLKCGYAISTDNCQGNMIIRVSGNKTHITPRITKPKNFELIDYDGKVYCYEVPNHLFITRHNGKVAIQGNTNRATLASQTQMFNLSVRDIINKTIYSIQKYMFKPLCELEGIKEIPTIRWDIIGADEVDNKAKRLFTYVKAGIIQPEELRSYIAGAEQLDIPDQAPARPLQPAPGINPRQIPSLPPDGAMK
jgi:hypothetical protein